MSKHKQRGFDLHKQRQEESSRATNEEVFNKVLELLPGDLEDGEFSFDGSITLDAYFAELVHRLKTANFLPPEYMGQRLGI